MCFVVVLWDLTLSPQEINCNFNQILRFDGSVRLIFEYNKCFFVWIFVFALYRFDCCLFLFLWQSSVNVYVSVVSGVFGKHKTKCCQLICIRAYLICYFWNTRSHWSCCIQLKYDQTQWMITFLNFRLPCHWVCVVWFFSFLCYLLSCARFEHKLNPWFTHAHIHVFIYLMTEWMTDWLTVPWMRLYFTRLALFTDPHNTY